MKIIRNTWEPCSLQNAKCYIKAGLTLLAMQRKYRLAAAAFLLAVLWAAILYVAAVTLVMAPLYIHDQAGERPGDYASLYLFDGSPYDRIVIEVHYEQGVQPSRYALEHLQSIVQRSTGKPVDLCLFGDIAPAMLPAVTDTGNISTFGDSFLDQHAHYRTGWLGGNISMYVLYVNGVSSTASSNGSSSAVAGVSFRADAFVIFDNYLYGDPIERTVLVHEAGHLLGLDHDTDPNCAMVGTLVQNLSMKVGRIQPPDDYCPTHQEQLARARLLPF